jgi:hypothetical protein
MNRWVRISTSIFPYILCIFQLLVGINDADAQNRRTRSTSNRGASGKVIQYDAARSAGLIVYDIETALKKMKLEKPETLTTFKSAVGARNARIEQLRQEHKALFEELNAVVQQKQREVRGTGKVQELRDMQQKIQPLIRPIRKKALQTDSLFEVELRTLLTTPAYEKWQNYRRSVRQVRQANTRPRTGSRPAIRRRRN